MQEVVEAVPTHDLIETLHDMPIASDTHDAFDVPDTRDIRDSQDVAEVSEVKEVQEVQQETLSPCEVGSAEFLCPCAGDKDCSSKWCVFHQGSRVCSRGCDQDCPEGWRCEQQGSGQSSEWICTSKAPSLCMPCDASAKCQDWGHGVCITYGADTGSFCSETCTNDSDCPSEYQCTESLTIDNQTLEACVKRSGDCTCSTYAVEKAIGTPCALQGEFGRCSGWRTCGIGGLSACSAPMASAEVCDGQDNDCDGFLDEGTLCDDGTYCTKDECAGPSGCLNDPAEMEDSPCSDGDECTLNDQCKDGECVGGAPSPLCGAICGNGICEVTETSPTCLADCPYPCGNGLCEAGENPASCAVDCGWCGDGVCGVVEAQSNGSGCVRDCLLVCGDKKCEGGESPSTCLVDCGGCGDGFCGFAEDQLTCLADCPPACGNGLCENGEDVLKCTIDCMPTCGDTVCEYPENQYSCPLDCTVCGDGVCGVGEAALGDCAVDCSAVCGDGQCEGGEGYQACPVDCGYCGDTTCGWSESGEDCPADCGFDCGDGTCAGTETLQNCPSDCTPDVDQDDVADLDDNCKFVSNPTQSDLDQDGMGDACDWDDDGDTYPDVLDNCPETPNPTQSNVDADGLGDVCDPDSDNDGYQNAADCAPLNEAVNPGALDTCDGVDTDCDGTKDNALLPCPGQNEQCQTGMCVCLPQCAGKVCGDNGCGSTCGLCPAGKSCQSGTCAVVCGDTQCGPGEDVCNCPGDCPGGCDGCCQDGSCKPGVDNSSCGRDGGACTMCDGGRTCQNHACEYVCGDGVCAVLANETCASCPADCGQCCGNGACDHSETSCTCIADCGTCAGCCLAEGCVTQTTAANCGTGGDACQTCTGPQEECVAGVCTCQPACLGRDCGEDGCGALCGLCDEHFECIDGQCHYVPWCGDETCGEGEDCATCLTDCPCGCGEECFSGICEFSACTGENCGDDGCGGTCTCMYPQAVCSDNICLCLPDCAGKECGDDGCGGICGECQPTTRCEAGACVPDIVWMPIPPGTFQMGCLETETCSAPQLPSHTVTLPFFEIMQTEVTQAQYEAVMGVDPSCNTGGATGPDFPVECVTWDNAVAFCAAIGGRLPTEAEWEYAARAGTTAKSPCGTSPTCFKTLSWYQNNSEGHKHAVKLKLPNAFGLHDVLGNVSELTGDWYGETYYSESPELAPPGAETGTMRVHRGGWYDSSETLQTLTLTVRLTVAPDTPHAGIGLRCVGPRTSCTPDCAGKDCGPNGCGGQCGQCEAHYTCASGVCEFVPWCGDGTCSGSETCSNCAADCACKCGESCRVGACIVTKCELRLCGDDGCGGTCGTCPEPNFQCLSSFEPPDVTRYVCVCVPDCTDKNGGDDGCGGTCPVCTQEGEQCVDNICVCTPMCTDIECGDNGCGSTCGTCIGQNDECIDGHCICQPDCTNKVCGDDGCGGGCGTCGEQLECQAGICV